MLVFEIWMCCFYHTSNTINLVTTSVDASIGIVEHTIFIPDVVDGGAPGARGHFRQIRRSDYEAARSICCSTCLVSSRHQIRRKGIDPEERNWPRF